MKRNIFFYIITIISVFHLSAEISRVDFTKIYSFPDGSETNELKYISVSGGPNTSPNDIFIYSNYFFIMDQWNQRVIQFELPTKESSIIYNEVGTETRSKLQLNDDYILFNNNDQEKSILIVRDEENTTIAIGQFIPEYPTDLLLQGLSLIDNILIGEYRHSGEIFSLEILADNRITYRNYNETIQYLKGIGNNSRLSIDEDGQILLDEEIFTRNFIVYKEYIKAKKSTLNWTDNDVRKINKYYGRDNSGNQYWGYISSIFIFDYDGNLIQNLKCNIRSGNRTDFSVDDYGNIYTLKSTPDEHILYKLERYW